MTIIVIGPKELPQFKGHAGLVNTTSRSQSDWSVELSPFHLGPVSLYRGISSRNMENAWQYSKVFEHHVGEDGEPSDEYWRWATEGWANPDAVRYPMGKGVRPAYCYWDGRRLTYVAARHQVYWPLYRNAVAGTAAFRKLQELAHAGKELVLFDFDGYHHEAVNMSLHQAISSPYRPMGHAFILKAMLELGANVTPDDVGRADRGVEQLALF